MGVSRDESHVESPRETVAAASFPCTQCSFSTQSPGDLQKHKESKHRGVRYICSMCKTSFGNPKALRAHKEEAHPGAAGAPPPPLKPLDQQQPPAGLTLASRLLTNLFASRPRLPCDQCKYSFNSESDLSRHKEKNHNPKLVRIAADKPAAASVAATGNGKIQPRIPCNQCDYKAPSVQYLQSHVEYHHGGGIAKVSYNCDLCDYSCVTADLLTIHRRSKHEGLRYRCSQCSCLFQSKGALAVHSTAKHDGSYRYSDDCIVFCCSDCGFSTTTSSLLRSHREDQHGLIEEPTELRNPASCITVKVVENEPKGKSVLKCSSCDYETPFPNALKNHIEYHHDQIRHYCDQCGYSAGCKSSIDLHKEFVHEGIRYRCFKCCHDFRSFSDFRRHMRRKMHVGQTFSKPEVKIFICTKERCEFYTDTSAKLKAHKDTAHQILVILGKKIEDKKDGPLGKSEDNLLQTRELTDSGNREDSDNDDNIVVDDDNDDNDDENDDDDDENEEEDNVVSAIRSSKKPLKKSAIINVEEEDFDPNFDVLDDILISEGPISESPAAQRSRYSLRQTGPKKFILSESESESDPGEPLKKKLKYLKPESESESDFEPGKEVKKKSRRGRLISESDSESESEPEEKVTKKRVKTHKSAPNKQKADEVLLCYLCPYKTRHASAYKNHIECKHEGKSYPCDKCDYTAWSTGQLTRHKLAKHECVKYGCSQCDKIHARKSDMKRHFDVEHGGGGSSDWRVGLRYLCIECGHAEFSLAKLREHKMAAHGGGEAINNAQAEKTKMEDKQNGEFRCSHCTYITTSEEGINMHVEWNHRGKRYMCDKCDYAAVTKDQLFQHKTNDHEGTSSAPSNEAGMVQHKELKRAKRSKKPNYKCDKCDYSTSKPTYLANHKEYKHMNRPLIPCDQCDYLAATKKLLVRHKKDVHQRLRIPCTKCDKTFRRPYNLREHMKLHDEGLVHQCDRCSRAFANEADLESHKEFKHPAKITKPTKLHKCEECDYATPKIKFLIAHKEFKHMGLPRKPCDQCDFLATTDTILQRHKQEIHEGKGRIACTQCNKTFRRPYLLKEHFKKEHEGVPDDDLMLTKVKAKPSPQLKRKEYKCNDCSFVSTTKFRLQQHITSNHVGIRFICDQCDFSCASKVDLRLHKQLNHEDH